MPRTLLDAWSLFLKNPNTDYKEEIMKTSSALKHAYEILGDFGADRKHRVEYEARKKKLHILVTEFEEHEKRGIAKGLEEGLKKGLKKGLEKGLEKGRRKFASAAIMMVEKSFGPLPEKTKEKMLDAVDEVLFGQIFSAITDGAKLQTITKIVLAAKKKRE
jgi:flagellar biosynthesis/type III secretory pathway protein FliH